MSDVLPFECEYEFDCRKNGTDKHCSCMNCELKRHEYDIEWWTCDTSEEFIIAPNVTKVLSDSAFEAVKTFISSTPKHVLENITDIYTDADIDDYHDYVAAYSRNDGRFEIQAYGYIDSYPFNDIYEVVGGYEDE